MSEPAPTAPGANPSNEPEPRVESLPETPPTLQVVQHPVETPEPAPPIAPPRKRRKIFRSATFAWIVAILALVAAATGFVLRSNTASDLSKAETTISTTKTQLADGQSKLKGALSQIGTLKASNQMLTGDKQALGEKVKACQLGHKINYQWSQGQLPTNGQTAGRYWTAMTACFGQFPPPWWKV